LFIHQFFDGSNGLMAAFFAIAWGEDRIFKLPG
jgi:hypothetical protein